MRLLAQTVLALLVASLVVAQDPTVLNGHTRDATAVAVSPDGKLVASGGEDATVRLFDLAKRELVHTFEGHGGSVFAVAFTPDGKQLVTGEVYKKLKIWDLAAKKELRTIEGFDGAILALAVAKDGKTAYAACRDNFVRVVDLVDGKVTASLQHSYEVPALVLSSDGARLVTGDGGGNLRIFTTADAKLERTAEIGSMIQALGFGHDGKTLYAAAADGRIRAFEPATLELRADFAAKDIDGRGLAATPNGASLVVPTQDGPVLVLDAKTGKTLKELKGHERPAIAVALTPDGKLAVTASRDHSIRVWPLAN